MIVRVQDPTKEFDEDELGYVGVSKSGAQDAARELTARLRDVFGFSDQDPLFITLHSA